MNYLFDASRIKSIFLIVLAIGTLPLSGGTIGSAPEKTTPGPCAPAVVEIPTAANKQIGVMNFDTEDIEPVEFFIEPSFFEGVMESCDNGKEEDATPN